MISKQNCENALALTHTRGTEPFDNLRAICRQLFLHNDAVAVLVLLAALSRRFSVIIEGNSSTGKSYLASEVVSVLAPDEVLHLSRCTRAGLFAAQNVGVIVSDERLPDREFEAIRRQLLSQGSARQLLATPDYGVRLMEIAGPVAFIDTSLTDKAHDFQDANRAIVVSMSELNEQHRFHATQTVRNLGNGSTEQLSEVLDGLQYDLQRYDRNAHVELAVPPEQLVPEPVFSHTSRRIRQVLDVAYAIVRLETIASNQAELKCERQHVLQALALLREARVQDDHRDLPGDTRAFLHTFGMHIGVCDLYGRMIDQAGKQISVAKLLEKINSPRFRHLAASFVHADKRHCDGDLSEACTRRIVDRHLHALYELGVLDRSRQGRECFWRMTPIGLDLLRCGSLDTFALIEQALHETRPVSPA